MRDVVSRKVKELQPSGIRAFFDLVLGVEDIISLGVGEPDFPTPWQIRESGIYALEEGFTTYTSNKGLYKLRLYIARYLKNKFGLKYDPDEEILITVGVSEGLDLAFRAILNDSEEVLVPVPSYVSYIPTIKLSSGSPVEIRLSEKNGFKLTPKLLEKHITAKSKAILLNYPSNPTGVSYRRKELEQLNKVIQENRLITVSDEIYGELTYDFDHTPFPALARAKENTVYLNGFSKAYAMTGWRLGYACGPKDIIGAMTKIHQYTALCAPIVSQMAACEALQESGGRAVEEMKREYKRRRELVVDALNSMGFTCVRPHGAFYVFASIRKTGLSSIEFAKKLLKRQKVAVVPGTAFGPDCDGYIRISYATSFDRLKEALQRIKSFLREKCR